MFKKFLLATSLLVLSLASHAGLISHYGYERDDASDIVTGHGLEWLQWDVTVGMSIDSALASYTIDGWKLASNQQMADLFNAFAFGKSDWDADEASHQVSFTPWDPVEQSAHSDFIELFGITVDNGSRTPSDPQHWTLALFGSDIDRDGLYKYAAVQEDYSFTQTGEIYRFPHAAYFSTDYMKSVTIDASLGVALVREVQLPVHNVSEPYTLSLLAFALIALGFRRRQALRR